MIEIKKFIALFLVFSVLSLSVPLAAKERKGANLIVQKIYGTQVRGELIAVKENSLLLLDRESGADVTVDISNIRAIKIIKKSQALSGALAGLVLGAAIGYSIGYPQGDEGLIVFVSKDLAGAIGAAIGAGIGALMGVGLGSAIGGDKTIQITGKSDSEIQDILEKLRRKARVRNAQ